MVQTVGDVCQGTRTRYAFKDGASFSYCAYVLRISGWSKKKKTNKQKPEDGAHKHKYEYDVLFSNDTGKLGKRLRVSLLNDTSFSFVHQAQNITSKFLSLRKNKYFYAGFGYAGKAGLNKGCWNSKENWGQPSILRDS